MLHSQVSAVDYCADPLNLQTRTDSGTPTSAGVVTCVAGTTGFCGVSLIFR